MSNDHLLLFRSRARRTVPSMNFLTVLPRTPGSRAKTVSGKEKVRSRREHQLPSRENCCLLRDRRFQDGETTVHSAAGLIALLRIGLEDVDDDPSEDELDFDAMDAIWSQDQTDKHAVNGVSAAQHLAHLPPTDSP
jgi:hypothetical protein